MNTGTILGSPNKGPGFRLYSAKEGFSKTQRRRGSQTDSNSQEELSDTLIKYLTSLSNIIYFYKTQHGTRDFPARSCRELYLEHPESPSGKYWIDPNEGCAGDAEFIYCDFERGSTCISAEKKQITIPNARPSQWMSESIENSQLINYGISPMQMRFLRLLSKWASQNITYHCFNSRAWENEDSGRTIKVKGDNELELMKSQGTKTMVLRNDCENLDNKWHQTVLEFNSKRTEALPVIDISPYDISTSDMKQEFFVEIGPVCFFY